MTVSTEVSGRRYRWIPWMFVAGLGLVVAVNSVLVYFATRQPVDVVGGSPYDDGLHYNKVIAERQREAAQGWHVAAGYFGGVARPGEVAVEVQDRAGKPIDGLVVKVKFARPIETMSSVEATLERTRPGRYSADVVVPHAGQWDLEVDMSGDAGRFHSLRRIVVR